MKPSCCLALVFLLMAYLASCAQLSPNHSVQIARNIQFTLTLPPLPVQSSQLITGIYRGESHTLLMQIEANNHQLIIAGLTPTGTRLFSSKYDGMRVSSWRSPLYNAPFDASFLVADYLLTTLRVETLNHLLISGHAIDTVLPDNSERMRTIYNRDANPVILIRYHASSEVDYCHQEREYCLHIQPLDSGSPSSIE